MRTLFCILFLCLLASTPSASFGPPPIPDIAALAKNSVLPILCRDSTWHKGHTATGTAVLIGDGTRMCALTCSHVVTIVDSLKGGLRPVSEVYLKLNKRDGSSTLVPAKVVYSDRSLDFAVLALTPSRHRKELQQVYWKFIPPSGWLSTSSLREGDPVMCLGYPLGLGIGSENHPLLRTGIIAQLVSGSPSFLIDGFVQPGHSGGPVFRMSWAYDECGIRLIGVITSFPNEYGKVLEEVDLVPIRDRKVVLNPGFSYVLAMDEIIPILTSKVGFKWSE